MIVYKPRAEPRREPSEQEHLLYQAASRLIDSVFFEKDQSVDFRSKSVSLAPHAFHGNHTFGDFAVSVEHGENDETRRWWRTIQIAAHGSIVFLGIASGTLGDEESFRLSVEPFHSGMWEEEFILGANENAR